MAGNTTEAAARHALSGLFEASRGSRQGATIAALAFLDAHSAGTPDVDVYLDKVRDDARFWAWTAHQAELEVYLVAAIMALDDGPILKRAAKRLAALGWQKMDASDRAAFLAWVEKNDG